MMRPTDFCTHDAYCHPQYRGRPCQRHRSRSGGTHGVLNLSALESAVAQPRMTSGGTNLYPNPEKLKTDPSA